MPNDITTIALNYGGMSLTGIQMDGQTWLRGEQLVPPLGLGSDRAVRIIFERNAEEFGSHETRLIVEQTAGGPQQVRVFSLRGARLLAFFAKTEPAARFRRWVLDLLEGRAPVAHPAPDALARLPDARAVLAQPAIRDAIARLDALDAADSRHQQSQGRIRSEIGRLARLNGMSLAELRKLRDLERILASIPSLAAQATLPLDA
jgi:muconolactone delta-isomerase